VGGKRSSQASTGNNQVIAAIAHAATVPANFILSTGNGAKDGLFFLAGARLSLAICIVYCQA
jgi:hypothetical protein